MDAPKPLSKSAESSVSELYIGTRVKNSSELTSLGTEETDLVPRVTGRRRFLIPLKAISTRVGLFILSILLVLKPSFIHAWGSSSRNSIPTSPLRPTAYLDGLRGVAALLVYFDHFGVSWFPALMNTYGASETDHYFLQLPIFRNLFNGKGAVAIFFVVSGYALSYGALSKIHAEKKSEVLDTLSSSVFRRCARLYIPCGVNAFIAMIMSYNDMFRPDSLRRHNLPPKLPTFSAQIKDYIQNQGVLMYPFNAVEGEPYGPPYNGHQWTIPLEIRGSWVIFGTVLAAAKLTPFWRLIFIIFWDGYLWYMGKWDLFLFVTGVLLSNLDIPKHLVRKNILVAEESLPVEVPRIKSESLTSVEESSPDTQYHTRAHVISSKAGKVLSPIWRIVRPIVPYIMFILGFYLLSAPHLTSGLPVLYKFVPGRFQNIADFYGKKDGAIRCVGAVFIAFSLSLSPPQVRSVQTSLSTASLPLHHRIMTSICSFTLQSLFTNAFSQYLGRISFGLYLMHGPIVISLGSYFLNPAWARYNETQDNAAFNKTFCLAWFSVTIVVFWTADIFTRVVDERSVKWVGAVARFMSRKKKAGDRGTIWGSLHF
ncbi:hypothetical protein VTL71DRAFT_5972 [Oculimacula yallundae]|uniref:Acyltransferase 3 domain-containing protein n=1 Tax=Oculimacula yallundae TaxID=86028 RepID=A0ABR4BZ55_9HELO